MARLTSGDRGLEQATVAPQVLMRQPGELAGAQWLTLIRAADRALLGHWSRRLHFLCELEVQGEEQRDCLQPPAGGGRGKGKRSGSIISGVSCQKI